MSNLNWIFQQNWSFCPIDTASLHLAEQNQDCLTLEQEPCSSEEGAALAGTFLKHQTGAAAPLLLHLPHYLSPIFITWFNIVSCPSNVQKIYFDWEKRSFSTSSIKFTSFPERRGSLQSSEVYGCRQTILSRNCPIALFWNIWKFDCTEKVSIF